MRDRSKIFLLGIVLYSLMARAQYVTIPDASFVSFLQTVVPAAMNGNQLDTTHTAVTTTTHSMSVNAANINDLTGIQYFKSLQYLECRNNNYTALPPLPPNLVHLDCAANPLTSLPALPGSLTELLCGYTSITALPALPSNLSVLQCQNNSLTTLPVLPHSLTYLDCGTNSLGNLAVLPPLITYLDCSNNAAMTALPALPPNLVTFFCASSNISNFPALPNSITWLKCGGNPNLTTLPALPTSLVTLECAYNYFTSLPAFPNSVKYINIYYSYNLTTFPAWPASLLYVDCSAGYKITSIPALPNMLQHLDCSFSPHLHSLPALPNSLVFLNTGYDSIYCFPPFPAGTTTISLLPNNVLTCLPNHTQWMDAATTAYPLCASGNPNGCPAANGIAEVSKPLSFSVFPNPTSDMILLRADEAITEHTARITIQNSLGQVVRNIPFTQVISIADLPNGLYNICVATAGGAMFGKFVKQ